MTDRTFIWANAAVLLTAAAYVRARIMLIGRQQPLPAIGVRPASGVDQLCSSNEPLGRKCRTAKAAANPWQHLLGWKLKPGSHLFPGPSGGTCVNEAALIAEGYEYRAIACVEQMPTCFSRPICRLALMLNDEATDEQRQRLLPYVTRLACAGTPDVERRRATYVNARTCFGFVAPRFEAGLAMLDRALAMGWVLNLQGPGTVDAGTNAAPARTRAFVT